MKVYFVLALMVGLCVLNVKATSPVRCPEHCNKDDCPAVDSCPCGTYLDQCRCCSFCLKCPGEECSFMANDRCSDGYECRHLREVHGPDFFNLPGTCVEKASRDL